MLVLGSERAIQLKGKRTGFDFCNFIAIFGPGGDARWWLALQQLQFPLQPLEQGRVCHPRALCAMLALDEKGDSNNNGPK